VKRIQFNRLFAGTFRRRLILSVATVHAILMTLFIVDLSVRQTNFLLERQTSQAISVANSLSTTSAGWIASLDVSGLQELVDAQSRYPELKFAMLLDVNGNVLAHSDRKYVGKVVKDLPASAVRTMVSKSPELVDVIVPVMISGRQVGWARVGVGESDAKAKLNEIIRNGIFYALAAILTGSIIAWGLGTFLARRLGAIQSVMQKVRSGDITARARLAGTDEAADLAGGFNQMLSTLEQRNLELKKSESALRLNAERLDTLVKLNQMTEATRHDLMNFAFESAVRLSRSKFGFLGFLNEDESIVTTEVFSRGVMTECRVNGSPIHFPVATGGLWADVIRLRRPLVVNDYNSPNPSKKGYPEGHVSIFRFAGIPVIVGQKIVLVAAVGNKEEDYDETDIQQFALLMEGMWRLIERRKAEEDRHKMQDRLLQAQKMETVGLLAGGIAHDFNNLLTPILGYSEMMLSSFEPGDLRHSQLQHILGAAERARDLIKRLLAFSRKQVIELKRIDLGDLISRFESVLRRTILENIRMEIKIAPDLGMIRADAGQLEQILLNLSINAQDAMPEGGVLTIEAMNIELDEIYTSRHPEIMPGPYVMFAVSDTGTGMDQKTIQHIFEPFFTTKELGKGTGLGLSTVYGIVKQHGGSISVYSEEHHGSTFKVFLPRAVSEDFLPEKANLREPAASGSETILVVEDDDMVRTFVRNVLEKLGYTVVSAEAPDSCVEIAKRFEGNISLLVTDLVMPGMNGRQLYELLHDMRPGMKVLFMSGYTTDIGGRRGVLDEGAPFIQKPFSMHALSHKVRQVLDSH
jgi:signal transduction histidine kinase/CheY-like chemotaxis protein/HAMP domain-containing protein